MHRAVRIPEDGELLDLQAALAVDTLEELLGEKKHPNVRLGAARTVAEIGMHQHEAETILKKLGEIEAYQGQHRR